MALPPVLFSHPASLDHDTGGHPERAERIVAVMTELERLGWLGYERAESPAATREQLERVHPSGYIEMLERDCAAGGGSLDADTVVSPGSFEAALRSAGGAVALVDRLLAGGSGSTGFSAHRPPGHHALPGRAMGFCLFANIAVAARHALAVGGLERVLIVDWDAHHGNGTSEIFYGTDAVVYASIHEHPLFPGTGGESELGRGAGRGYTVNLPVPTGSGDAEFVSLLRDVVVPIGRTYRPQLILLSAGFDAHEADPLAGCRVTDAGFAALARILRELAIDLEVPVGAVLEGGYALEPLARSVALTMDALRGGDGGPGGDLERGEPAAIALAARSRLREFWPVFE